MRVTLPRLQEALEGQCWLGYWHTQMQTYSVGVTAIQQQRGKRPPVCMCAQRSAQTEGHSQVQGSHLSWILKDEQQPKAEERRLAKQWRGMWKVRTARGCTMWWEWYVVTWGSIGCCTVHTEASLHTAVCTGDVMGKFKIHAPGPAFSVMGKAITNSASPVTATRLHSGSPNPTLYSCTLRTATWAILPS